MSFYYKKVKHLPVYTCFLKAKRIFSQQINFKNHFTT